MGQNIVGIESGTSAPIVKVVNTCTIAAFCNSALDQVIAMDYTNANAPIYAFKGMYNVHDRNSISGSCFIRFTF